MIHTETKFAYRHKPTGKWVYIDSYFDDELWDDDKHPYVYEMQLMEHFADASIESENSLRSNLKASTMKGERYAAQNFLEFELVEVEIEYRLKE
jgi:6-phosphogluconolactonase/glucosamine-6-phosphate isomerase/deaminase